MSVSRPRARAARTRSRGDDWRRWRRGTEVRTGVRRNDPRLQRGRRRQPRSEIRLRSRRSRQAVRPLSALGTEDRFVTSSIPVAVPRAGEEARTVYSPIASRLNTELRMPSQRGPMRLFIETDFAGSGRTSRLRHAFLQTSRFVVGQTWSTFSDPEADTIGIDFEGLNAISRFRQPLFRAWRSARITFRHRCWSGSYAGKCPANLATHSPRLASAGTSAASSCRAGMRTTASSLPSTSDRGSAAISLT